MLVDRLEVIHQIRSEANSLHGLHLFEVFPDSLGIEILHLEALQDVHRRLCRNIIIGQGLVHLSELCVTQLLGHMVAPILQHPLSIHRHRHVRPLFMNRRKMNWDLGHHPQRNTERGDQQMITHVLVAAVEARL